MRVLIVGGGMGGLALAHALSDYGDVQVLERDHCAEATGGYRLHLDARACAVLEASLPPGLMTKVRGTSDRGEAFSAFTIADDRLRPIIIDAQDPAEERLLCDRVTLRTLLADGLGRRVRFGASVAAVHPGARESVVVLDSGEELRADVVIGAEGAGSPTVTALAGGPTALPTGLHGIAGSTRLRRDDRVPPFLLRGPGLALSGNGTGLFLSLAGSWAGGDRRLIWGLITRRATLPAVLPRHGTALTRLTVDALRGWEPRLLSLVAASDGTDVAAYTFRAADPRSDLTPWTPGLVSAIGDAVHCMPPTGGQAATTAIRDAGFLAHELLARPATVDGARAAITAYEDAMPRWAVPAIQESLGPVRVITALRHPLLAAAASPVLRLAGLVGQARRRGAR